MQELVITIGLPASGKSTWAANKIQNNPEYVEVNRDSIRLALQGRARYNKFSKWREDLVTASALATAVAAINAGKSVIISDTNLNPGRNQKWKDIAKQHGVQYREKLFTDVYMGELLDRDARREFPVGQRVITGMFEKGRGVWFPELPVYDPDLPDCWIVDIDGTLAQMNGRGPFEWMKVDTDLPNQPVIDLVNTLSVRNKIIIMSGRDGICKGMTEDWLWDNNVAHNDFFIRPAGDNRKDTLIKEEIYNNHIKGKFNVNGVLDDRDQVVHLWRHLGLPTFQVNYGAF